MNTNYDISLSVSIYLTTAITFAFDLMVKEAKLVHVLKCFSDLLSCSHFELKSLNFIKEISFHFDVGIGG